jgi:hypothetical protein
LHRKYHAPLGALGAVVRPSRFTHLNRSLWGSRHFATPYSAKDMTSIVHEKIHTLAPRIQHLRHKCVRSTFKKQTRDKALRVYTKYGNLKEISVKHAL